MILVLPLAWALWQGRALWWRPALMVVIAALTVIPWTIRNYVVLDHFVPVSTQFGSAMAGTYNDQAQHDPENPASWRIAAPDPRARPGDRRHPQDQRGGARPGTALVHDRLHRRSPGSVVKTAFWTTRRMLDLGGMDWSIHTASTISRGRDGRRCGRDVLLDLLRCWR